MVFRHRCALTLSTLPLYRHMHDLGCYSVTLLYFNKTHSQKPVMNDD